MSSTIQATTVCDPRLFVKLLPVATTPEHGIRVKSRNESVYTPSVPSRDDIRVINYVRRELQLSSQGYRAPNNKVYSGVGDPFYLDQKSIILSTLGQSYQLKNDFDEIAATGNKDGDHNDGSLSDDLFKSSGKFTAKPTPDTETLNKEISHNKSLIRNVRLGHDLFNIIRRDKENVGSRNGQDIGYYGMYSPPPINSDHLFSSESTRPSPDTDILTTPTILSHIDPNSGRIASSIGGNRDKVRPQSMFTSCRPFTPKYNDILSSPDTSSCCKSASFRQLCALHWLLEEMAEDGSSPPKHPIFHSWRFINDRVNDDSTLTPRTSKYIKSNWQRFISSSDTKQKSSQGLKHFRSVYPQGHVRTPSVIHLPSPPLDESMTGTPHITGTSHNTMNLTLDGSAEGVQNDCSLLDEITRCTTPEQTTHPKGRRRRHNSHVQNDAQNASPETQRSPLTSPKSSMDKGRESQPNASPNEDRPENKWNGGRKSRSAAPRLRPKSCPHPRTLRTHSRRHTEVLTNLAETFKVLQRTSTLTLHKAITEIQRNRQAVCEIKYVTMLRDYQRTPNKLNTLRARSNTIIQKMLAEEQNAMKRYTPWFHDLYNSVLSSQLPAWKFQNILSKIQKFALVDASVIFTAAKFFNSLSGLRSWEICQPDVASAIDFCRRHIVNVPLSDYENWFQETFPHLSTEL